MGSTLSEVAIASTSVPSPGRRTITVDPSRARTRTTLGRWCRPGRLPPPSQPREGRPPASAHGEGGKPTQTTLSQIQSLHKTSSRIRHLQRSGRTRRQVRFRPPGVRTHPTSLPRPQTRRANTLSRHRSRGKGRILTRRARLIWEREPASGATRGSSRPRLRARPTGVSLADCLEGIRFILSSSVDVIPRFLLSLPCRAGVACGSE